MKRSNIILILITAAILTSALTSAVFAKIDLVTLPTRDTVQLTIYNSADLTLARESRALTLAQGKNSLQFSWENTLIDPTSLDMIPKADVDKIDIAELVFPPRVRNVGIWNIDSSVSEKVPIEISYLTSGLSWRAFYMGTLTKDEKTMQLQGYVRVSNNSGEDYENAQTRLIVGKVHIIDQIADLARRETPYGSPIEMREKYFRGRALKGVLAEPARAEMEGIDRVFRGGIRARRKDIKKEGLSEYFLYTIEGTETIPYNWSKRLLSFDKDQIPVVNLYKFEQNRHGDAVIRFLSFKNDSEHKLGQTPIPGGMLKVYRSIDEHKHLSYEGQSAFKYIPVDEDVELNLGPVADVVVKPTLMKFQTDNYQFDRKGNISGYDEIRTFKIEVKNTRPLPVKIEITRNFNTQYWSIENAGKGYRYEKIDLNTVKYTLELQPISDKTFEYTLTTSHGSRQD